MRAFRTLKVPVKVHPLVKFIYVEMNRQRVGIQDLSERAGLGEGTITKWKKNRSPQIEALEAAINALGYDLTVRVQHD